MWFYLQNLDIEIIFFLNKLYETYKLKLYRKKNNI